MGTPASSLGWFSNGGRGLSFTDVDSSSGRRTWSVPISFQYFFLLFFLSEYPIFVTWENVSQPHFGCLSSSGESCPGKRIWV